jgi:hypothetical protein
MAQGDFSASQLLLIKLKAEQMWSDSQQGADYQPNANAAVSVLAHQTARFDALEDREKDNKIKVTWIKNCDIAVADCSTNCDLVEPEVETAGKDYEYDICKKTGFSINEEKLRTNTYSFAEVVAPSLAKAVKVLDEFWAQRIILKLKAFSGVNIAPKPFTFSIAKNATVIPNALYGSPMGGAYTGMQLPTMFIKQMTQNKIQSSYYLDNGRMWLEYNNSMLMRGTTTDTGVAGLQRAQNLDVSFDLFNFATSGVTNVSTFAIGRNAVAFKTTVRNSDTPTLVGGSVQQTRYTVNSIALAGVKYDVYYTLKCVTINGKSNIMHTWRLETNGGIWLNPEGCPTTVGATPNLPAGTYTPTGVLAYVSDDEMV